MEKVLKRTLPDGRFANVAEVDARRMRAVKGSGNRSTEARFRAMLERAGIGGWTVKTTELSGKPDFYFTNLKLAIFLDGCYWHGCPKCGHIPMIHRRFWSAKIARNKQRDREKAKLLRIQGIRVLRFWEHELRHNAPACLQKLQAFLAK